MTPATCLGLSWHCGSTHKIDWCADGPLTAKPDGSETPHSFVIANRGSEEGIMEYNEGEKDCG